MPYINPPGKPTIYQLELGSADTEYSQVLPDNTKAITVQLREAGIFRIAFVAGKVASPTAPYFTIQSGGSYSEQFINAASKTLYIASPDGTKNAEILVWSGG